MTNLLLQDATFGRTPRQRGSLCRTRRRPPGVATLLGCDNVQDASARRGATTRWTPWPAACSAPSSATCLTGSRG